MLIAGVSEKIITPDFPAFLTGYPEPLDRYHNDVHDDIKAHCFYLKNHDVRLAIITLDLCYYSKSRVRMVREEIEAVCGIPAANIMISTTHTHSAPAPAGIPFGLWNENREMYPHYLDWINRQIVAGVREAMMQAFPADIAIGHGLCGREQNVGGNRRDKDGPADPEVWTVAIRDDEQRIRGILVNYALHPTFLHAESYSLSADYPCYIYEYFQQKDPAVVVGFQMGASGNQSSRHFRSGQTFEEARRVGHALAREAERVLQTLSFEQDPQLFVRHADLMPALKPIPEPEQALADQQAAELALETARNQDRPYAEQRTLECTLIGANRRLAIARAGSRAYDGYQSLFPFDIMLIGIGSGRIVSVPCEIFVEFGLRLKQESPCRQMYLATVTNGASNGYLFTRESYEEGGYEPLVSIYTPEAGDQVIDTALALLREDP
jgi:hypothetical protein